MGAKSATAEVSIFQLAFLTFHGIEPVAFLFSNQVDFAHITFANKLDLVEAGRPNFDIADLDGVGTVRSAEG